MNVIWQLKVLRSRVRSYVIYLLHAPIVFENWVYYLRAGFAKGPGVLRLRSGPRFLVRPRTSDRSTVSEVFVRKPYENEVLGYVINKGDVVVDVGANIGAFSVFAAWRAPEVTVYALEPAGAIFQLLQRNIEMNERGSVTCFNVGMDGSDGERTLSANGSSSSFVWNSNTGETVKTVSLSSFMAQQRLSRVSFLKMDCEGAEFDILFNADSNTLSRIKRIAMEFHNVSDDKNALRLCEFLNKHGFQIDLVAGEWNGILLAHNTRC